MSKIEHSNPQIAAIKSQYLEAQKNHDTSQMNKLRAKGMELIKNIESSSEISNKDGDLLHISKAGLKEQKSHA